MISACFGFTKRKISAPECPPGQYGFCPKYFRRRRVLLAKKHAQNAQAGRSACSGQRLP